MFIQRSFDIFLLSFFFSLLDDAYPWYNKVMRLDKLLGQAGYGSRNQVKKLIRSRQVYVDGILAERDNLNVDASLQTITVLVRNWSIRQKFTIS